MTQQLFGARASMEPCGLQIQYEEPKLGELCTERCLVPGNISADEFSLQATFDGEQLEVVLHVHQPLQVHKVEVQLRHAFASDEMVMLNGYQSCSETCERLAFGSAGSVQGIWNRVTEHGLPSEDGDYAAPDLGAQHGKMHGFTYATFRRGLGMVLVGSLNERDGFTLITTNAAQGVVCLQTEPPARPLLEGQQVVLGHYAITRGTQDECYRRYFQLAEWQARPVQPLVGYTSWNKYHDAIDQQKLQADLAAQLTCDNTGLSQLFLIEQGYCTVGDWVYTDKQKFPQGLKPLADEARAKGLLPGVWYAPFVCEEKSRLYYERSSWLLRDSAGNPVRTGPQRSGMVALDTRNVDVRSYVLDVLRMMTKEWGFGLIKADYLFAACMIPHDGLNRGQLMADALDLLRRAAGEDTLILASGVPLGAACGAVDYCSVCNVILPHNPGVLPLHLLGSARAAAQRALSSTYARKPLDGRAFANQPNAFALQGGAVPKAQRDELLFAAAECGSMLLSGDDPTQWNDAQSQRYDQALRIFTTRQNSGEAE